MAKWDTQTISKDKLPFKVEYRVVKVHDPAFKHIYSIAHVCFDETHGWHNWGSFSPYVSTWSELAHVLRCYVLALNKTVLEIDSVNNIIKDTEEVAVSIINDFYDMEAEPYDDFEYRVGISPRGSISIYQTSYTDPNKLPLELYSSSPVCTNGEGSINSLLQDFRLYLDSLNKMAISMDWYDKNNRLIR